MDLSGGINSIADWLSGLPVVGWFLGGPLQVALLITATAAVIVMAMGSGKSKIVMGRAAAAMFAVSSLVLLAFRRNTVAEQNRRVATYGAHAVLDGVAHSERIGGAPIAPRASAFREGPPRYESREDREAYEPRREAYEPRREPAPYSARESYDARGSAPYESYRDHQGPLTRRALDTRDDAHDAPYRADTGRIAPLNIRPLGATHSAS